MSIYGEKGLRNFYLFEDMTFMERPTLGILASGVTQALMDLYFYSVFKSSLKLIFLW